MRLGGPVFEDCSTPESFVRAHKSAAFSAAFCALPLDASDDTIRAYAKAAKASGIVFAEVGVWNNPLSPDSEVRKKALAECKAGLSLADRVGALCCVNISGSRGDQWDGPHAANLTQETFDMIVSYVRDIIDAVKPTRTFYTLEPMPWMYPDSADSYLRLIRAIDRKAFAVHYDPVNLVASPEKFFAAAAMIREFFAALGPYIKSCHAKDVTLSGKLTVHIDEALAGKGALDYRAYLTEVNRLGPDIPLMVEHMHTTADAAAAANYVRSIARKLGIPIQ